MFVFIFIFFKTDRTVVETTQDGEPPPSSPAVPVKPVSKPVLPRRTMLQNLKVQKNTNFW